MRRSLADAILKAYDEYAAPNLPDDLPDNHSVPLLVQFRLGDLRSLKRGIDYGWRPRREMKFQWCAHGIYFPYIECKKCKRAALTIREGKEQMSTTEHTPGPWHYDGDVQIVKAEGANQ